MNSIKKYPIVSAILVAINVVLFLVCTFDDGLLYNKGSISILHLMYKGEYYRLLSSMFLHADIQHLVNNMLLLYGLGYMLEKELGHVRFLIYYLVAGVGGDIFSLAKEYITKEYCFSIGASGAVYGLIGILLIFVITMNDRFPDITWQRVAFVIVYALYSGFQSVQVNNAAHIGGLIVGIILGLIYCLRWKHSEKDKWEEIHEN